MSWSFDISLNLPSNTFGEGGNQASSLCFHVTLFQLLGNARLSREVLSVCLTCFLYSVKEKKKGGGGGVGGGFI